MEKFQEPSQGATQDSTTLTTAQDLKVSTPTLRFEIQNCHTHGKTEHRVLDLPWSKALAVCQECESEYRYLEKVREDKAEAGRIQNADNKVAGRLTAAHMPLRVQDKGLAKFEKMAKGEKGSAEKACQSAEWFLKHFKTSTGMILIGKPGTGKTHLACGIIRHAVMVMGKTASFTELRKVDRAIKESWKRNDRTESDVFKRLLNPDLLVIDEVGVQRGTEAEAMHLTEIINDRYNAMKPTILIGNITIKQLQALVGERAVERFKEGGRVVLFDWESYRGRG